MARLSYAQSLSFEATDVNLWVRPSHVQWSRQPLFPFWIIKNLWLPILFLFVICIIFIKFSLISNSMIYSWIEIVIVTFILLPWSYTKASYIMQPLFCPHDPIRRHISCSHCSAPMILYGRHHISCRNCSAPMILYGRHHISCSHCSKLTLVTLAGKVPNHHTLTWGNLALTYGPI